MINDANQQVYTKDQIEKLMERYKYIPPEDRKLIIDGQGTEKIVPYPVDVRETPIKRPQLNSYEEALEWNKQAQEHTERAVGFLQEYAEVRLNPVDNNKVFLVNGSDLHWGHNDVDYDFLDSSLKIIEDTPNIAMALGWNILDAAIPAQFPDGLLWSGQSAQEQVYTFRDKLKQLDSKHKILAAIGDCNCHEGWMKKKAGWAVYRELFEGIDVPLLINGGYLDINVGEQKYRLSMFHKPKYWSSLNKTHGGYRLMDRVANSEIIFTSHYHQASIGQEERYNPPFTKDTAVVASGTCKIMDHWGLANFGTNGTRGFQGIILYADRHKFQVVYDLEIAKDLMK